MLPPPLPFAAPGAFAPLAPPPPAGPRGAKPPLLLPKLFAFR